MALFFHPHIVDLIDQADELLQGSGCWESFQTSVATALETHGWQRERFAYFQQSRARTQDVQRAASLAAQAFEEREEALGRLAAGDEDVAALTLSVLRASQRLAKASEDLEALTQPLAPFPLAHDFLQAGANVIAGMEGSDVLASRLPALVAWIKDLSLDWEQERELFPALEGRHAEFEQILEGLKQGVGAVVVFLDQGSPEDLSSGLSQVGQASRQLAEFLSAISADSRLTRTPYREIERWILSLDRGGPALDQARQGVLELLESQQRQLQSFGEIPFDSDEYIATFEQLESTVGELAHAFESADVERLCQASVSHRTLLGELSLHLAAASADLEKAPALQELRRLMLGVYYGQTPRRFLKSMLDALTPGFESALANETSPAGREALQSCLQAAEHAYNSLAEGSVHELIDAWRALNEGGSALIVLDQERERLAAAEAERRMGACPRCGARSGPGVNVCACGARLVRAELDAGSTVSFSDEPSLSEPEQPRHLRELLTLAARIQEGIAEQEEIRALLDPHVARARQIFAQASRDGASGAFQLGVSKFQAGLQHLAKQADERDLEQLARGVELLMEGTREIQESAKPS